MPRRKFLVGLAATTAPLAAFWVATKGPSHVSGGYGGSAYGDR